MSMYIRQVDYLITPTIDYRLRVLDNVDIVVEDDRITCIAKQCDKPRDAEVINGSDRIVFPGIFNIHTHIGTTILYPYLVDKTSYQLMDNLMDLGRRLREELMESIGWIECIKMLSKGIIGVNNMFYYSNETVKPCIELGMYVMKGPVIGLEDHGQVSSLNIDVNDDRVIPVLNVFKVDPDKVEQLNELIRKAERHGFKKQLQVSTTRHEVFLFKRKTGKWPIEYLVENDLIDDNTSLAHVNWISNIEISLLNDIKPLIVVIPSTTMFLGERGYTPVYELLDKQIPIAIGCEGFSNPTLDILSEIRQLLLLYRYSYGDNRLTIHKILPHIFLNPYKYLNLDAGILEPGRKAIFTIASYRDTSIVKVLDENNVFHVFTTNQLEIEYVIIDGNIVFKYGDERLVNVLEKHVEKLDEIKGSMGIVNE